MFPIAYQWRLCSNFSGNDYATLERLLNPYAREKPDLDDAIRQVVGYLDQMASYPGNENENANESYSTFDLICFKLGKYYME